MKKIFLPLAALAIMATSCGNNSKAKRDLAKKQFIGGCAGTAKKEMASMPGMDPIIDEYCSCSADKVIDGLTDKEIEEMDKNPNAVSQSRVEELSRTCLEEFTKKVQAKFAGQ